MGPPKCKTCGKTEWRHICAPPEARNFVIDQPKYYGIKLPPKPSRKEYLKLKARERRARQKAAKSA